MRHLKLFEGFLDPYYYKISSEEYYSILTNEDVDKFDKIEDRYYDWLKKIFVRWLVRNHEHPSQSKIGSYIPNIIMVSNYPRRFDYQQDCVTIYSIDEWYYVVVRKRIKDGSVTDFYKCDQFEGLKKCLQENILE